MQSIIFGDIEKYGIVVYVEGGMIHEATEAEDIAVCRDTQENRLVCIRDAEATIAAWND